MSTVVDDLVVTSSLQIRGDVGTRFGSTFRLDPTEMVQLDFAKYPIPLTSLRVWNAMETLLPGTSSSDDLGLYGGAFTTASPIVKTFDVKTLTTSLYARFQCPIPERYVAGQSVTLRLHAGQITTVADTTCTLDVEAYRSNGESGIGSDLCATAAQSIKSLTFADKDFTITPGTINPGDMLDVRITIAVVDAATVAAVYAAVGSITLLCDIQG